ncbi:MAG: sigma-70 family RNA polymerase sigma factor [Balneolaceae bacterium]|nr:sigma-70 family RNA polymerase sigma factor [Balneolaceae bacterium]
MNYKSNIHSGFSGKGCAEDDLWCMLQDGKREALDELFRKFYTSLFNYGIKITPNADLVKDAIQELFYKIWSKHASLSNPESIKAYLLISLRRILLRNIDKGRNWGERNLQYLNSIFSTNFSKQDLIIRKELEKEKKELLVNALNELNSRQKEALFLRYYHGLTNHEIASVMGINYQSVKNNLSRALKSLRGIIDTVPFLE